MKVIHNGLLRGLRILPYGRQTTVRPEVAFQPLRLPDNGVILVDRQALPVLRRKAWLAKRRCDEKNYLQHKCGPKAWDERELQRLEKLGGLGALSLLILHCIGMPLVQALLRGEKKLETEEETSP